MNYIKNRSEFLFDNKIFEKLKISDGFKDILDNIDNPVSGLISSLSINDLEKTKYKQDNIDLSNKIGYVSFGGNNEVKIGRFVNKLFNHLRQDYKSEFNNNPNEVPIRSNGKDITEKDIQDFVVKFNDIYNPKDIKDNDIKVFKGDIINEVYQKCGVGSGTLGNSCMVGKPKSIFSLYTENPNQVSIATMWEGSPFVSNLMGRALLWEANKGKFMDRIYTSNSDTIFIFKKWANLNGFIYRENQSFYATENFMMNGVLSDIKEMEVQLDNNVDRYPYMDTFKYYNSDDNILYNYPSENSDKILESTYGGFEDSFNNIRYIIREVFSNPLSHFTDLTINKGRYRWDDDDIILSASDWSDFIELFKDNESYSFIKSMLIGDSYEIFDNYYNFSLNDYWSDINENNYKEIISKIRDIDNSINITKIDNKMDLDKLDKDIDISEYNRSETYYVINDNKLEELSDFIDNNDDLYDLKIVIKNSYSDAQSNSNQSEAFDDIIKSISNYLGDYIVDDNIRIKIDIDDIRDKFVNYGTEDFDSVFVDNTDLLDLIIDSIKYFDFPGPEFTVPYYGYNGDASKYVNGSLEYLLSDMD